MVLYAKPCVVCGEPTMPCRTAKDESYRYICQPCRIAESACSRLHGIESELRHTSANIVSLNHEVERLRAAEHEWHQLPWNKKGTARSLESIREWQRKHGSIKKVRRVREDIQRRLQDEQTMYGAWQNDPLGLNRISDDRDFIERFLHDDFQEATA
jgi:hypothetical protein